MVGLGGLEPPTSPLSGARSSHLSYRPILRNNSNHPKPVEGSIYVQPVVPPKSTSRIQPKGHNSKHFSIRKQRSIVRSLERRVE